MSAFRTGPLGIRIASKVARGIAHHLVRLFAALPEGLCQTITFDNDTEFACHLGLHRLRSKPSSAIRTRPVRRPHRECDRSDAPLHPAQDRPRFLPDAPSPPVHQCLQQHLAQMSRF
jgi:hypothetical protein